MSAEASATRVLIAGVSTRAAAESAARAGYAVTAIDAFADLDQHPAVRALSLPRGFGPRAAVRAGATFRCDAVAYLSSFDNHPDAVNALAVSRALWGNAPRVLREVRNPRRLADALASRGFQVPALGGDGQRRWLLKPLASGGGVGVRPWRSGARIPRDCYVQEQIEGVAGSVIFVASGRHVVLLGLSRQLIGESSFGARGYQYCGNIMAPELMTAGGLLHATRQLTAAVVDEFDLVGVNGIDFILRDGVPYPIEVNPRWCASMELVERVYGVSVFGAHATSCADARLPAFDLDMEGRVAQAVGKAVVYARQDVTIGDTRSWLSDETVRDIPRPRERIRAGHPVCTVFASGRDDGDCYAQLERRAAGVYEALIEWEEATA